MNARRHDPDELRAALTSYGSAEAEHKRLCKEREDAVARCLLHASRVADARVKAADLLRKEGGSVVHDEIFWKLDEQGRILMEPVRVNLDDIEDAKAGKRTPLHLKPVGGTAA